MTDEALIEKMAEAIANENMGEPLWPELKDYQCEEFRQEARAALSVVRDHDKQGLVHAQSTGAERSSYLSAGKRYSIVQDIGETFFEAMIEKQAGDKLDDLHCATVDYAAERVLEILMKHHRPTDDRSAPAAPREPDLPPSLLSRLEDSRGLTTVKRD